MRSGLAVLLVALALASGTAATNPASVEKVLQTDPGLSTLYAYLQQAREVLAAWPRHCLQTAAARALAFGTCPAAVGTCGMLTPPCYGPQSALQYPGVLDKLKDGFVGTLFAPSNAVRSRRQWRCRARALRRPVPPAEAPPCLPLATNQPLQAMAALGVEKLTAQQLRDILVRAPRRRRTPSRRA